jgi:hypothetical protein
MVLNRKLNRTMQRSASIGVVTARLSVSTMPEKLTSDSPGPHAWVSILPSITPRGVGNFCDDRMIASGNPVVYSSSSGTVAVLCTNRKCAESTAFSAISCTEASMVCSVRMTVDHSGSPFISGNSGTSHIGGSSSGWYQTKATPLRSTVG